MEEKISQILGDINPQTLIDINNDFIDNAILDSFDIMNLVTQLEEAFEIEFEPEDVLPQNFNTLENIVSLMKRKTGED